MSDPSPVPASLRSSLDAALRAYDRPGAVAIALDALDAGAVTIPQLYDLLAGLLVDVGAAWQEGSVEVWQEHHLSAAVRTIVEACVLRVEAAAPSTREATVVLAAPAEEYHDLGLRMLGDRFALAGWRVHLLGPDVPAGELVAAVGALSADAVALSASTHFHRLRLREYVAVVRGAHPSLRLWVGGPAFAHDAADWPEDMLLDPHRVPAPEVA